MARDLCTTENCSSPTMARGEARRLMGRYGVGGMCLHHSMAAGVALASRTMPKSAWPEDDYVPVDPYRDWLNEVLASGTLTFQDLTIRDLRRKTLAKVVGIHEVTISKIANGHTSWVRTRVWRCLTPFMVLCSTSASWTVEVGQRVEDQARLKYVPPGTGVVDGYGRIWQHRDGAWAPAHTPGKPSRYGEGGGYTLHLPVRIIYLPPVLQDSTTY